MNIEKSSSQNLGIISMFSIALHSNSQSNPPTHTNSKICDAHDADLLFRTRGLWFILCSKKSVSLWQVTHTNTSTNTQSQAMSELTNTQTHSFEHLTHNASQSQCVRPRLFPKLFAFNEFKSNQLWWLVVHCFKVWFNSNYSQAVNCWLTVSFKLIHLQFISISFIILKFNSIFTSFTYRPIKDLHHMSSSSMQSIHKLMSIASCCPQSFTSKLNQASTRIKDLRRTPTIHKSKICVASSNQRTPIICTVLQALMLWIQINLVVVFIFSRYWFKSIILGLHALYSSLANHCSWRRDVWNYWL